MDPSSPGPRGRSLSIVLLLLLSSSFGLLAVAPRAAAAGPFYAWGHLCTNTWQAGDTWIINATAVVDSGCTLTIAPGALVNADPGVHLYVNGTLVADGVSGNPILFGNNQTTALSWVGIQFNKDSTGSVTWSRFSRAQIAIAARLSSPAINNNTIVQAGAGVYLEKSSSAVADNLIDGKKVGSFGIILNGSNAIVARNQINGTVFGIQGSGGGSATITGNTITNTSGTTAIAVYLDTLTSATVTDNVIQTVVGRDGGSGQRGGTAVGILLNGTGPTVVSDNLVEYLRGGARRGGSRQRGWRGLRGRNRRSRRGHRCGVCGHGPPAGQHDHERHGGAWRQRWLLSRRRGRRWRGRRDCVRPRALLRDRQCILCEQPDRQRDGRCRRHRRFGDRKPQRGRGRWRRCVRPLLRGRDESERQRERD